MESGEALEKAVEAALLNLIEAIYRRSEALARHSLPGEVAELDARVARADEAWRQAKEVLRTRGQITQRPAGTSSEGRGLPAQSRKP